MEAFPELVVESESKESCEKMFNDLLENDPDRFSDDIFGFEFLDTATNSENRTFWIFEWDVTYPEKMIEFLEALSSDNADIDFWCFLEEEPAEYLVKGQNGQIQLTHYEVEITGIPSEGSLINGNPSDVPVDYESWHKGLPAEIHYGAHAPGRSDR